MRVERLNDNQIQFILLPQDLAERNLTVNDILTQSGGKTQGLFLEITQLLQSEYDFYSMGGTSLVFEARMSHDSLCIIVTRMDQQHSIDGQSFQSMLGDFVAQFSNGDFSNEMLPPPPGEAGHTHQHNNRRPRRNQPGHGGTNVGLKAQAKHEQKRDCDILSFPDFDMLATAAAKIPDSFMGYSFVCKHEGKYFLIMEHSAMENYNVTNYMPKLCEYGTRVPANPIAQYQLRECGEVIIPRNAVQKLKLYSGFNPE